jgi:uncharacterized protein (TIGR00288 family)
MQDRLNIAVFVDYDNIEIGVKSTLRREFDVSLPLGALKERGDLVAKFAYANWGRQEGATRQMAENAVQMVQRIPSPRGDKNGADINLALDALEMAFTHAHVNAFAIVSGDSDFIPLVNKLKEYGKTVFVVGGKAFTSTILQQNCHEFVSYESLLEDGDRIVPQPMPDRRDMRGDRPERQQDRQQDRQDRKDKNKDNNKGQRPAPLELSQAMPLVERALQVLERRAVQPQLGLLKSTMLQLDPAFSERAYGACSFSDFVEKLKKADFINVSGSGGRYIIERRGGGADKIAARPEDALPALRDVLETHRMELEEGGATAEELEQWMKPLCAQSPTKSAASSYNWVPNSILRPCRRKLQSPPLKRKKTSPSPSSKASRPYSNRILRLSSPRKWPPGNVPRVPVTRRAVPANAKTDRFLHSNFSLDERRRKREDSGVEVSS